MMSIAAAAIVVVAIGWVVMTLHPMPPRAVTMATGPEGGSYHEFGKRYREIFARAGIDLRLIPSDGGVENLRRLRDPRSGVDIGFTQGGTAGGEKSPDLVSLGTVSYEPLWFFYRGANPGRKLEGLRGKRISIGPEGSGTRALALELLAQPLGHSGLGGGGEGGHRPALAEAHHADAVGVHFGAALQVVHAALHVPDVEGQRVDAEQRAFHEVDIARITTRKRIEAIATCEADMQTGTIKLPTFSFFGSRARKGIG